MLKLLSLNLLIFFPLSIYAATSQNDKARQAADCLAGHITLETEQYRSGETQIYFLLIQQLQGAKKGMLTMRQSLSALKNQIQQSGNNKIELAKQLIHTRCPGLEREIKP